MREAVMAFAWWLLHVAVCVAGHAIWYPMMPLVFLELAAESLFLVGLYLLLAVVIRNPGLAFLVLFVYYFLMQGFFGGTMLQYINILADSSAFSAEMLLRKYLPVALLGVLFLWVGFLVLKKRRLFIGGRR